MAMDENVHDTESVLLLQSRVTRSVDGFQPPIEADLRAGLCMVRCIANVATLEHIQMKGSFKIDMILSFIY